jgi:branched-chain amino acid transport system permease protein
MRFRLRIPRSTLARHALLGLGAVVLLMLVTGAMSAYADFNVAGIGYFAIAAAGLNLLTGVNGQLSLGHGALMAIGAYTTAVLLTHVTLPAGVVVLISVATTAVAGVIIGVAAARLRGPYLAGVTLALAVALPQVAVRYASLFGGDQGLAVPPLVHPAFLGSSFPDERWQAWIALILAGVTFVLLANLLRGGFGRSLRAVRDDEVAAALSGINVRRTQVIAFVVSAGCAGLAGSLFAYVSGIASPSSFPLGLSLQLLTAIVVGGLGTLWGAVWGAALLVYLPIWISDLTSGMNLSSEISNNLPLAVYGAVLVAAMLAFPRGIQGAFRWIGAAVQRRLRAKRHRGEVVAESDVS